jgi:hypothetical protein
MFATTMSAPARPRVFLSTSYGRRRRAAAATLFAILGVGACANTGSSKPAPTTPTSTPTTLYKPTVPSGAGGGGGGPVGP